jgi:hypothetical protein
MTRVLVRLRHRLTFANVASGLALFVALGGTSYAAINLPANSVGSDQIRTGAVGSGEIRTDAVRGWEIRRGAVGQSEVKVGGVGASELHTGSVRTKEIKDGAVGTADVAKDAVTADQIKDGSVGMSKLDDATRGAIAAGALGAAVGKDGAVSGDAKSATVTAPNVYTVEFGTDVSKCIATATAVADDDPNDGATTSIAPSTTATSIVVKTFGGDGTAAAEPFHVVLSC